MIRRLSLLPALGIAAVALAACGGGSEATSGSQAAAPAASGSASAAAAMAAAHQDAFCKKATALGSLSQGTGSAMAMSPAESVKDFQALSAKVAALKADAATPALMADIDAVSARLGFEQMVMSHKADGTSPGQAMQQLDTAKPDADAAVSRLVAAVKQTCGIDIA